jgi:transposase
MVTQEGHSLSAVCRDLELDPKMLRRWKRELERDGERAFPGQGRPRPELAELQRLRRENERLRQEREILKKALTIFSEEGPQR